MNPKRVVWVWQWTTFVAVWHPVNGVHVRRGVRAAGNENGAQGACPWRHRRRTRIVGRRRSGKLWRQYLCSHRNWGRSSRNRTDLRRQEKRQFVDYNEQVKTCYFLMGQSRPLFVYFRSFLNSIQMTCTWDSNPGPQDSRRKRNHGTIAAASKNITNGREPWSSDYGRRLMFWRSWVWIPALHTGWTFFTFILL